MVKYLTKECLVRLRSYESYHFYFAKSLSSEFLKRLDPAAMLPIVTAVPVTGKEPHRNQMRCRVAVNGDDRAALVDMPIDVYEKLPAMELTVSA